MGPTVRDELHVPLTSELGASADSERAAFARDRPDCLVTHVELGGLRA